MGRSQYKIYRDDYPHLITSSLAGFTPVFRLSKSGEDNRALLQNKYRTLSVAGGTGFINIRVSATLNPQYVVDIGR